MQTDLLTPYFHDRGVAQVQVAAGRYVPRRFHDLSVEHDAARNRAALFDFSFMSHFEIDGPQAREFLQTLQPRPVAGRRAGSIVYTVLCREDGSVFNDATVWVLGDGRYWLFTGRRSDRRHVCHVADPFDVTVTDRSGCHSVIAVQGPRSAQLLERSAGATAADLRYFRFGQASLAGVNVWVGRIGYTGEHGYELLVGSQHAVQVWERLVARGSELGVLECGFDAANCLRIEAGYILFDRELTYAVTPDSLGYGRLIDGAGDRRFVGARRLRDRGRRLHEPRLRGLVPASSAVPDRQGPAPAALPGSSAPPVASGQACLTSACWSPLFKRPIGMGYVHADDHHPGTSVTLQNGQRARVARLPYYDPARAVPRR